MVTISLNFDGYWREANKKGIPDKSGIYCVYTCTYNHDTKKVTIHKLLYIGESNNVNDRINNHERLSDWKNALEKNQTLCYSFAPAINPDRERAEAALIYKHKPPMNDEYVNSFTYNDTSIILSGNTSKLVESFVIYND
ncbi:MAG: GIY-YIG nuclease family protein [Ruminococcaceae bacterium]|nr:GIY-YIG nuclease family protein [Oscillospiraceae bacterium]